ncbi:hypothetical protein DIS18_11150 [Algibacter marinivivus]|uniref:Uncharacterized protein n=1 Tax=Algibacter marinivivus TaxID=2100723 RepID=A0A2U2X4T1_9FLAO|nr:hypothetical protein [Algibacter marinivivus]PWH82780.1 hypothetical protein DIS18_11150 [Algibacter marinivivus]
MKKSLQIFITIALISSFLFSQNQKMENNIKYFDENYNPILKTEYENRKWENGLLSIQGDSINHKILSVRENRGTIENKKKLDSLLTSIINKKIDSSKTIVIIYYPGKDLCNSSGSASKSYIKSWFKRLEKKLYKITQTKPIYIYKDKEGLEKYGNGVMNWYKDPNEIIEKLFFKYHYPCSSFVTISKKGDFISYFGEFSKEYVWKSAEILTK